MRQSGAGNRRVPDRRESAGAWWRLAGARLLEALGRLGRSSLARRRPRVVRPSSPAVAPPTPRMQRGGPRSGSGFVWVWGLAVALATAAFVLHLNVRFEIIRAGYALSRAQSEQRGLRLSQRELRLELATLKSPGRIEGIARESLGMVRPEHDNIVRLGDRRSRLALRRR